MDEKKRIERLTCPYCGYGFTREEHPSAVYCGPHKTYDGYVPAKRMLIEEDSDG